MTKLSRRGFLAFLGGGGVAATALGWMYVQSTSRQHAGAETLGVSVQSGDYVDHDGWIITVADKEKLDVPPEPDPSGTPER
jgi:hypothetical protein